MFSTSRGVQGVQEVKNHPSAVKGMFVFVKPPSMQELEERLKKRGADSEEAIQKKLAAAQAEISAAAASDLFDKVIVNDDADRAYNELKEYLHNKLPATFTSPKLLARKISRNASHRDRTPVKVDADMPVREYMQKHVVTILKRGMNALNEARPADPLQYLADYLVSHKPAA